MDKPSFIDQAALIVGIIFCSLILTEISIIFYHVNRSLALPLTFVLSLYVMYSVMTLLNLTVIHGASLEI